MIENSALRIAAATALRWSIGARMATLVIGWAATLVVIRLLHPEDYGLMALVMVVITFATLFNELGASAVIVRTPNLSDNEIGSIQGLVAALNLSLAAAVFFVAPLVSAFYGADITALLRTASLLFVAYSIGIVQEALLIRAMNFKARALVETTAQLAHAAVTLTLALNGFGVWSLVLGLIVARMMKALGFLMLVPQRFPWRLVPGELRRHLAYCGSLTAQRLLYWLPDNVTTAAIGILAGPAKLGLFAVGKDLALLPLGKFGASLNEVGFATYSRAQAKVNGIKHSLEKSIAFVSFCLVPYAIVAAAIVPVAVPVVLGKQWILVIPIIQLILIAMPFRALNTQVLSAINAAGLARVGLQVQLVNSTLLVTFVTGGALWSIETAAAGWTIAMPAAHLFNLLQARRAFGMRVSLVCGYYWRSALIGLAGLARLIHEGNFASAIGRA